MLLFSILVEFLVPAGEVAEAGAEGGRGAEAEVALQGCGVSVGHRDVAGLHRHEFLVGLEIVVGGQDAGGDEFFLEDADEVEEVLGVAVADVVELVWRHGQAVVAVGALGGVLYHADYALDDVVDVGKVALAVAVVEYLNCFTAYELVGEAEVGHVGAPAGSVDGEEAQAGGGDVVELGVGVGHELVAFLGGGIERHGVVDFVVGRIWHFLVRAVDRRAGGVDEMAHAFATAVVGVAAGFEDIVEADEVAFHVCVGVGNRVSDAGLGGEVDYYLRLEFGEYAVDGLAAGDGVMDEDKAFAELLQLLEALIFEAHVVVIGDAVDADYAVRREIRQKSPGEVGAYESSRSGNENRLAPEAYVKFQHIWNFSSDFQEKKT